MHIAEIIIMAVALAMDAFAVSVCKGMTVKRVSLSHVLKCGIYFGGFQMLMPIIGFFIGKTFADIISSFDHWVVFAILTGLGIHMIIGAFKDDDDQTADFSHKTMLILAIATSIDALAIGVSLSVMKSGLWVNVSIIGAITFAISSVGVIIGNRFGNRLGSKAELIGGCILAGVGVRILIEHLITGA